MEKNQLITQLSAKEEEIRHLTTRLDISEQSRALFTASDSENDKIKLLLQERKMLENRLEEAHLHLYDIKSSWTSQNLTLENQLQRLSRQVAEETAEKRKAFETKEAMLEKIKQLELEMAKSNEEMKQRDNKVNFLEPSSSLTSFLVDSAFLYRSNWWTKRSATLTLHCVKFVSRTKKKSNFCEAKSWVEPKLIKVDSTSFPSSNMFAWQLTFPGYFITTSLFCMHVWQLACDY